MVFDSHGKRIVRYDVDLNYLGDVFVDSGSTDSTDCEEVYGIIGGNNF